MESLPWFDGISFRKLKTKELFIYRNRLCIKADANRAADQSGEIFELTDELVTPVEV